MNAVHSSLICNALFWFRSCTHVSLPYCCRTVLVRTRLYPLFPTSEGSQPKNNLRGEKGFCAAGDAREQIILVGD